MTSSTATEARAITHAAHADVAAFLTRYTDALDDGRVDEWADFFTDDGNYQITTRENEEAGYPVGIIYCEGRGMLLDRIKALKVANIYESHVYCHINGQPTVLGETGGLFTVRSNFVVYRTMYDGRVELFATGKYLDVIRHDEAGLRFKERRAIVDSRRIDTLLVFPI
ncbi:anthranilate 1,2-dioxygenase small subunit [Pigmentiphaga litoralis]|uniref:aromatic-ring-hydroxylating dioxygenase subunit beta n=1 Tax=Pigmentiphaga litoralis TaxID=516702 RepID=UPI0016732210|nr:aromatic-ring-hydroxylating dioxygenase subunit beta [Pigmentiphaga litoralis]GGX23736.1 anthranilate 1,2-dioxygenase small subunit [Pigmentiphaga litoralis]